MEAPARRYMELKPGDKLGPYEIVSAIGKGGMGEVWKARDPRLGRDVAIKVSARQFDWRSEREARAIAALNHPNICHVYDVGPNYLVMEFIDGSPPRGPLAAGEAVKLALGIAAGLEAAHDKGITHRDLKPANMLITGSGVKLLDFGLATRNEAPLADDAETAIASAATIPGTILGTAGYMSPEQVQGRAADARSDIFAFGVVLYELLSGRRAFAGESALEVLAAVLHKEPEPLQLPGGHAPAKLSEIAMRCLRKAPDARFQTMSEVRAALENVTAAPVAPAAHVAPADATPSIAVLPFANMSRDPDDEYFSDGLAEEILNLLAKITGLRVIARTSVIRLPRTRNTDIRKIAEALGVRTILEGSVRRAGNRIRVTAQLIEAEGGSHLWSERYDRDMTDVFAVQDEIAQAISDALKVKLAPRTRVVNVEAWEQWLKGVHYRGRNTPDYVLKAKEHFERALAIDPNYAQAYSGIALCYYVLAAMGARPADELTPLVYSAAEKALAIDPSDSETHMVLAVMAGVFNYDWACAGKHHRMSVECENVSPRARFVYGSYYLAPLGKTTEAIEQSRLALQADPLSLLFHSGLAWCLICAGQYREAIACAHRAMEIDPDSHLNWLHLGFGQMYAGLSAEAVGSFGRFVETAPWHQIGRGCLAAACWLAGDHERGAELALQFARSDGLLFGDAIYYAAAGEADKMFEALDAAYRRRDLYLPSLPWLPSFDPYRADPRFRNLLERMSLA